MRFTKLFVMLALVAAAVLPIMSSVSVNGPRVSSVPHFDHIFVLVEENHGYYGIISNPYAPTLNRLAKTYGIEQAFGLGCLQYTCDTKNVKPMTPLFKSAHISPLDTSHLEYSTGSTAI